MPRGRKRSVLEALEWLERYEKGEGLASIAAQAHRVTSTVWEGIQAARRQRDDHSVREGLLRVAYQQHQRDLLEHAKLLGHNARTPNPGGLLPFPDRRMGLLDEALKAHIPNAPLWQRREEWERAARYLDIVRKDLRGVVGEKLAASLSDAVVDGIVNALWDSLSEARETTASPRTPVEEETGAEGKRLVLHGHILSRWLSGDNKLKELRQRYVNLEQELTSPNSELLKRFQRNQRAWEEAREAIEEEVEILLLRRVVPGRCRLCPGAEAGEVSRRRARKKETG